MRLVVDNIRGKKVADALAICKFTNKEAGMWLEKLVLSAISNWENKADMVGWRGRFRPRGGKPRFAMAGRC